MFNKLFKLYKLWFWFKQLSNRKQKCPNNKVVKPLLFKLRLPSWCPWSSTHSIQTRFIKFWILNYWNFRKSSSVSWSPTPRMRSTKFVTKPWLIRPSWRAERNSTSKSFQTRPIRRSHLSTPALEWPRLIWSTILEPSPSLAPKLSWKPFRFKKSN